MVPGSLRYKPPPKLPDNWRPPVFEPIEKCPKGTWYKVLPGGGLEVGANLPRGVRFVMAWISVLILSAFGLFLAVKITKPIDHWPIMVLVLTVPAVFALGIALYRTGAVILRIKGGILTLERGVWIFRRRRRMPIAKVEKVRLIPRSTTYTFIRDDLSVATVDMRGGNGLTMAFAVQTEDEEIEIASDLDLQRTFYLRYVLVKAIQEAKLSAASAD